MQNNKRLGSLVHSEQYSKPRVAKIECRITFAKFKFYETLCGPANSAVGAVSRLPDLFGAGPAGIPGFKF